MEKDTAAHFCGLVSWNKTDFKEGGQKSFLRRVIKKGSYGGSTNYVTQSSFHNNGPSGEDLVYLLRTVYLYMEFVRFCLMEER